MKDILRKKIANHNVEVKETGHEIDLLEERINGLNEQLSALQRIVMNKYLSMKKP